MGTPDFSVPALRAIAAQHEVVAVYSQPPRPAGRGKKDRPSPVQSAAEEMGLPVRHPARLRDVERSTRLPSLVRMWRWWSPMG
jgi:methionyl-tRNA formyltransferase